MNGMTFDELAQEYAVTFAQLTRDGRAWLDSWFKAQAIQGGVNREVMQQALEHRRHDPRRPTIRDIVDRYRQLRGCGQVTNASSCAWCQNSGMAYFTVANLGKPVPVKRDGTVKAGSQQRMVTFADSLRSATVPCKCERGRSMARRSETTPRIQEWLHKHCVMEANTIEGLLYSLNRGYPWGIHSSEQRQEHDQKQRKSS